MRNDSDSSLPPFTVATNPADSEHATKHPSEREAVSRLIAAAPMLLEALQTLCKRPSDYLSADDWMMITAAVNTATGREDV